MTASPASRVSHVSKSSLWKKADERSARRVAAREPSPDMAEISAQNQSEQTGFDDKLAGEIAAEGLDMDRDWYLREEDGGIDEAGGGYAMEDESTYKRGQRKDGAGDGGAVCPSPIHLPACLDVVASAGPSSHDCQHAPRTTSCRAAVSSPAGRSLAAAAAPFTQPSW